MPLARMSKVSRICVAVTMVAAPAVLLAAPASAQTTFSNPAAISIPLQGTSSATELGTYPSDLSVSGLSGTISSVTVTLSDIVDTNGTLPDLSVLLQGPTGSALSLLSAAGGFTCPQDAPNGLTVTLDDAATADTTYGANLGTSGATGDSGSVTVKPADFASSITNGATNDTFPSPAPSFSKAAPTGSATLASVFGGTNPNGTWKLFVTENADGDGATGAAINGWSLDITTNPGPVVSAGGSVTFAEGGSAVALDSGLAVTDGSSASLAGATVAISSGFISGDSLNFTNQNGITGSYNAGSGVLTLTEIASVADYQTALQSVTYDFAPSNGDPTDGGTDTSRAIDWSVNDGSFTSSTASSTLDTQTNTFVVNACTDTGAGSGNSGDLLYAVTQANANPGSTITFDPSLSCTDSTITLSSTLDITSNVTITGPGASALAVSGGGTDGVFEIEAGPTTISGLTITDGYTSGSGAGVSDGSGATLTLDNDTISDDTSSINPGGGVYFSYRTDTDTLTLDNDTFSGDTADNGGYSPGGAILDGGANATLDDDTFSDDTSIGTTGDAGIYSANGTVTISNSILDNSSCGGTQLTDGGYNVESDDSCGLSGSDSPPSVVNSTTIGLDTSLAANGSSGPETLAIGPASSAFEEVPTTTTNYCTVASDERALPRPGATGQACDAGAYEYQGVAPAFTSADSTTFTVGMAATFSVITSGSPPPSFGWDNVPPGVTFTDNHNGTATLAGTPTTGGTYVMHLTATNGVGSPATQTLTVTVGQAPSITSADTVTFTVGTAGTFSVTTSGYPNPAISEPVTLPSTLTFTDNGDGTATLSGTPANGTQGSYPFTITAANGVGTNATQSFLLDVSDPVSVSNPGPQTSTVGTAVSLQVNGSDAESLPLTYSATGLPPGLSINSTGGLISGTPTGPSSPYSVTVTATDGSASASVMFNWQVNLPTQAPSITSASSTTFVVGTAGSFAVTTTGDPSGSSMGISESGKLPSGVSFTNNANGTATISGTPKTGTKGTYPLTITASNGVSPNATQRFTLYVKYPTTLSVLIAPSPDKVGSALIAAAVLSADDSGGTVSFSVSFDGGAFSPITTCQNKTVYLVVSDCTYTPTSQGTYTIGASFSGDISFAPSSGSASVNTLLPTTLALSFSTSPHKGSALVVSAKVSPTPSSGTAAFAVHAPNGQKVSLPASCSSAALSAGVANCSFTPSQDGTYTVSAAYSGNSMDEPSSNNATVKVTG